MKIMVASDIHGSAAYCRAMMEAFHREGSERLLLLGDLLYHGPRNPLPEGYAPMETASLLNAEKDRILCVRGNCDAEVDQMVLDFPIMAEYCLLPLGPRKVFVTHGHHFHKEAMPPLMPGDFLLHGHTHLPAWEELPGGTFYLNPGSVALPKEGSPRGYMILAEEEILWKDLSGGVYHRLAL